MPCIGFALYNTKSQQHKQRRRQRQAKFLRKVHLTVILLRHFRAWNAVTETGQRLVGRADRASDTRLKTKADRLFRYCGTWPWCVVDVVVTAFAFVLFNVVLSFKGLLHPHHQQGDSVIDVVSMPPIFGE